jgi:2,2-dialkylglycine decarboxylase (pyruvate)
LKVENATAELLKRAERHVFRARLDRPHYEGPVFVRGEGSRVWDAEGKEYLDFNSGQLCAALGHSPPRVVEAISRAARTMIHSSSTYYNRYEIELAERLTSTLPPKLQKGFFALSGSDASEAAINIAKKVTGRYEVASPHTSFHGLSDTPRAVSFAGWHKGIPPPAVGSHAMFAPYCFRCPVGQTYPECEIVCLSASMELLDAQTVAPLAAVITEPLFSAGGVIDPPPGWLPRLRDACAERGALLILDESQTGLAKTGAMWAFEHEGVEPDILTVSKHFGGGVPISAVVTSADIEEQAINLGFQYAHSHTSDPLACAAALAVLETIEEDGLVDRAQKLGSYWHRHLEDLQLRHEVVGAVRGRGLLQGFELCDPTGRPAVAIGRRVFDFSLAAGLLFSLRRGGSVLRFTPPFTTTEEQMDWAAEVLDKAMAVAASGADD